MAYQIIGEDGKVKQHKGKDVMGSIVAVEASSKSILDQDKRIVEVVTSSDRRDRDGDRILQEGIDHQFAKSVLYAHDYGRAYLPIGKLLGHRVEKREGFMVTIEEHQINPPGAYDLSDAAWKLIEFQSLNATSIGFIPGRVVRAESDEERDRLGLGRWGVLFETLEKLETSWVPVQSNRDAIREAYGKGIISPSEKSLLFPTSWAEINTPNHWAVEIDLEEKGGPGPDKEETDEGNAPEAPKKKEEQAPDTKTDPEGDKALDRLETLTSEMAKVATGVQALVSWAKGEAAQGPLKQKPEPEKDAALTDIEAENPRPEDQDESQVVGIIAETMPGLVSRAMADAIDKRIKYHLGKV